MRFRSLWFALLGLWLLSGCAHQSLRQPTGLKPADFWKDQKVRLGQIDRVLAKLKLTFHGRNRSVTGRGLMVRQPEERIRLELRDPFGRVHYLVAVDNRRFTAYYPQQKLAYLDRRAGNAYVADFLGMDFSFPDLQNVMLGAVPFPPGRTEFKSWEWNGELGQYVGILEWGKYRMKAYVEPERAWLERLEVSSPAGDIDVRYSHFEPCCHGVSSASPISVAQVVELKFARANTALEVEWERIRALEELRPASVFRVRLGKDDEKIQLK